MSSLIIGLALMLVLSYLSYRYGKYRGSIEFGLKLLQAVNNAKTLLRQEALFKKVDPKQSPTRH